MHSRLRLYAHAMSPARNLSQSDGLSAHSHLRRTRSRPEASARVEAVFGRRSLQTLRPMITGLATSVASPHTEKFPMNHRTFGKSNIKISDIGFGAWAIGGGWGPQADDQSIQALSTVLDLGVNFIDTAAGYGDGRHQKQKH